MLQVAPRGNRRAVDAQNVRQTGPRGIRYEGEVVERKSRQHTSDEFGRAGLGSVSASGVIVDGLVETEGGATPGPGLSGRTITVAFAVLILVAVAITAVFLVLSAPVALPVGSHSSVWVGNSATNSNGTESTFELMPDVGDDEETPVWTARVGGRASILIDGRVASVGELADYLRPGMVRADVTASDEGVISRIEILSPE